MSKEKLRVFVPPTNAEEEKDNPDYKPTFNYTVICLGGSGWTIGLDSLIFFTSGEREGEYYHAHVGGGAQLLAGPLSEEEVAKFKAEHEIFRKQRGY